MKKKEIFDSNILIAEFMRVNFVAANNVGLPRTSYQKNFKSYSGCKAFCEVINKKKLDSRVYFPIHESGEMKYHLKWEWLMPVIQKIARMPATKLTKTSQFERCRLINIRITASISDVYDRVISFICEHNLSGKPKQ